MSNVSSDRDTGDHLAVDFDIQDPSLTDVSEAKDRGVLKRILKEGIGSDVPFVGSTVFVHYTGRLPDGAVFDSSRTRGEAFTFVLGKRNVIKGWDQGVATMKKRELCELVCSADYAYGKNGSGAKIPPNATLVFQVELLDWQDEDVSPEKNKQILRRVLKNGTGYTNPNDGSKVKIRLSGRYQEDTFEPEHEVEFVIDEAEENHLVPGIEHAVKKMKKLETSQFIFHPDMAFGREGKPESNVPSGATVQYHITLLDFEKAKDTWSMSVDEKLEACEKAKEKGTKYFTAGSNNSAAKQYKKMKEYVKEDPEFKDEKEEKRKKLYVVACLNLAAVELKRNELYEARSMAEEALKLDADNIKGLYRRGLANFGLKEYEDARRDLQRILELEPENAAAKQQLTKVAKEIRAQTEKEQKKFRGMFDKFAAADNKGQPPVDKAAESKESGDHKKSEATA